MSVAITPVALLKLEQGQPDAAELWHAITEQQLADWESEWMPELFGALQRLKRAGVPRQQWPQSAHWDWRKKTSAIEGLLSNQGFSIVCDGVTQGMMIVETVSSRCRIESQKNLPLVYVEYVENAPWNRPELMNPMPRYRGIGSILIRAAIELSKQEEFKGRIGLHSLPQADSFYATTCGMTDLGIESGPPYAPMRYFEMTSDQAEAFIKKGQKP
jgi:hypothetical protein